MAQELMLVKVTGKGQGWREGARGCVCVHVHIHVDLAWGSLGTGLTLQ